MLQIEKLKNLNCESEIKKNTKSIIKMNLNLGKHVKLCKYSQIMHIFYFLLKY